MPANEATVADLDEAIYETVFTRTLSQTPRSLRGANTVEDRLKRLNFTDAEGCVIRAGLLVAGVYPQQFFPKLHVDVAIHPGAEKSIGGALRFRDRVICEGTLGEMSMRELAEESGMTLNQVRRRVNELIDQGRVEATAPTTSRNRKYRLRK